jgi:hypothetical protein
MHEPGDGGQNSQKSPRIIGTTYENHSIREIHRGPGLDYHPDVQQGSIHRGDARFDWPTDVYELGIDRR